jgi:hypothetical protein
MNPSTPSGFPGSGFAGAPEQDRSQNIERIGATGTQCLPLVESGPVFADPSGRRRRVLRYAGRAAVACLAACLGAVFVAMTGGPQAPFTQWAVQPRPATSASGHVSARPAGRASGRATSGPSQNAPAAAPVASAPAPASPSPFQGASPSAQPSVSATASTSAVPVNPAGKTPPGHTKSPNPHSSARVA